MKTGLTEDLAAIRRVRNLNFSTISQSIPLQDELRLLLSSLLTTLQLFPAEEQFNETSIAGEDVRRERSDVIRSGQGSFQATSERLPTCTGEQLPPIPSDQRPAPIAPKQQPASTPPEQQSSSIPPGQRPALIALSSPQPAPIRPDQQPPIPPDHKPTPAHVVTLDKLVTHCYESLKSDVWKDETFPNEFYEVLVQPHSLARVITLFNRGASHKLEKKQSIGNGLYAWSGCRWFNERWHRFEGIKIWKGGKTYRLFAQSLGLEGGANFSTTVKSGGRAEKLGELGLLFHSNLELIYRPSEEVFQSFFSFIENGSFSERIKDIEDMSLKLRNIREWAAQFVVAFKQNAEVQCKKERCIRKRLHSGQEEGPVKRQRELGIQKIQFGRQGPYENLRIMELRDEKPDRQCHTTNEHFTVLLPMQENSVRENTEHHPRDATVNASIANIPLHIHTSLQGDGRECTVPALSDGTSVDYNPFLLNMASTSEYQADLRLDPPCFQNASARFDYWAADPSTQQNSTMGPEPSEYQDTSGSFDNQPAVSLTHQNPIFGLEPSWYQNTGVGFENWAADPSAGQNTTLELELPEYQTTGVGFHYWAAEPPVHQNIALGLEPSGYQDTGVSDFATGGSGLRVSSDTAF